VKSVVRHRKARVVIKVKLQNFRRLKVDEIFDLSVTLRTNRGARLIEVTKLGDGRSFLDIFVETRRAERPVRCQAATKRVSGKDDLIEVSIPRKCLGNPRWIKASLTTIRGSEETAFFDDALRSGSSLTAGPRFTPKLKRG
jgi:hypothetical protein